MLCTLFAVGITCAAGFSGCSNVSEARTQALQNRQQSFNNMADAAAERRAIRSQNADARSQATFDAIMQ